LIPDASGAVTLQALHQCHRPSQAISPDSGTTQCERHSGLQNLKQKSYFFTIHLSCVSWTWLLLWGVAEGQTVNCIW